MDRYFIKRIIGAIAYWELCFINSILFLLRQRFMLILIARFFWSNNIRHAKAIRTGFPLQQTVYAYYVQSRLLNGELIHYLNQHICLFPLQPGLGYTISTLSQKSVTPAWSVGKPTRFCSVLGEGEVKNMLPLKG